VRKQSKSAPLPAEELISDLDDAEAALVDRLDGEHYRDDVLRLLFICCHPDLPATQQVAVALRIVSGLSVGRSPAPSWSASRRWSSGSPAPRPASARPTCRSARPESRSGPSG
jgi:hypothetical protein